MGTSGLIGSGITGLLAAQMGLQTTQHNISNANTAGFSRQRTTQESALAMLSGAGFIGMGTRVATVERLYSGFLTEQVNRSQSSSSQLDSYYAQIKQVDDMLGDATAGLSPELQSFFSGAQKVATNPADLPSRQALIANAQTLSTRYRSLGDQLAQIERAVDSQIAATVAGINDYAEQIAAVNQRIVIAQASSGQPANDLLDTRDHLLAELNKQIRATTTTNTDGSLNVFVGTGQQLVVGTQAMSFTTSPSLDDPSRLAVGLKTATGSQEMPE